MTEADALLWIREAFGAKTGDLRPETRREDIPNWDSIGMLSLMAEIDERCGIVLEEKELEALGSVGDILTLLRRHGKLED